jgi:Raf kinase inhibitor-like YbhB/YbcL family protein
MTALSRLLGGRRAGTERLSWNLLGLQAPATIEVGSDSFAPGGELRQPQAGPLVGDNVSPELHWTLVPTAAAELVLVLEDPDAPGRRPLVHTIARLEPHVKTIPAGGLAPKELPTGVTLVRGSLGNLGYIGPTPPKGHGAHRYVFQLYALDARLELPRTAGARAVIRGMRGHVLARGRVFGTYERA